MKFSVSFFHTSFVIVSLCSLAACTSTNSGDKAQSGYDDSFREFLLDSEIDAVQPAPGEGPYRLVEMQIVSEKLRADKVSEGLSPKRASGAVSKAGTPRP